MSAFHELDAWVARFAAQHAELRTLCRESRVFRIPKPLATGGFRLRTKARFNTDHKADAVDECFHGSEGFENAKACIAALLVKHPLPAPASKGGAE